MRKQPGHTGAAAAVEPHATDASLNSLVLERVSDAFISLDRDWRYVYVNPQAAAVLGRRPEDMLGERIWSEDDSVDAQPFYEAYHRAMQTQQFVYVEDYYAPFDRWFENRIYPSADGVSVFFHDVTDRKCAETLLRGQMAVLELIANGASLSRSLHELLCVIEANSRPGTLCSILLLDPDGIHLRHGAAPSLPASFTAPIDGASIGAQAGSCGTAAFRREAVVVEDIASDPLWADYRGLALPHGLRACWSTPIFGDRRELLGTFAMYRHEPARPGERDHRLIEMATHLAAIAITRERAENERRQQALMHQKNLELEEANRAALEANRLKSEFLANMSHELRTPLNAIMGFSEFLSDQTPGPLNPTQSECLGHVLTSARHLLRLINDVLDLAKVEAGRLELFPEEFALCEVLEEVCSVARALGQTKSVVVEHECDSALQHVRLDRQKLMQVLFNLMANAVKFTESGGRVDVEARAVGQDRFVIEVRDNGIGIAEEDLPRLFQAFGQLDGGAGRRHEGTGLGLALAKRLVESQHGKIGVESTPGCGSTFSILLPRTLP